VKIFFSLPEVKPGSNIKIPNVSHIQVYFSIVFQLLECKTRRQTQLSLCILSF
jgi:hypothetical protein